jgi:transglutaminase-like putative cysteine protease
MSISQEAGALALALVVLSLLACSLPIQLLLQSPTPETIPSATWTPPATASPHPPSSTPTSIVSPTARAFASTTPKAKPSHTATMPPPPSVTSSPQIVAPTVLSQVDYQVVERIVLTNAGPGVVERLTLWVALIRSLEPYQLMLDQEVQPAPAEWINDEYGNSYARIELGALTAGESIETTITNTVKVNELAHDLALCSGDTPSAFLDPETFVESDDPAIQALARELSSTRGNACETLRTLYDYVADHLTYTRYESGDRGAAWAFDHASGDCTEFADALLALSRAAGIPARFLEGVTYREEEGQEPGQIKHDWLEAYLPGHGWVPLDPTWGRFANRRDAYFAQISPDHIIVTVGRNLSTLGRYHYFYYTWSGVDVSLSHQETWTVSKAP